MTSLNGVLPRVQISYFDPFHVFASLRDEIEKKLPLTNLHWKAKSGNLKTILTLNVEFIVSDGQRISNDLVLQPFINCVIVSCESVEDYRAKIRPLIKNWLPTKKDVFCKNVVILHSNKEVLDSNLFKSVSLIEKFNKDFPDVKTIETKTVYKSNQEKELFLNGIMQRLKQYLLEVFQERTKMYENALESEKDPIKRVMLHENLLKIYLSFQLTEETDIELGIIQKLLTEAELNLVAGELSYPIFTTDSFSVNSISSMASKNELTSFKLTQCVLQIQLELYLASSKGKENENKLYSSFQHFLNSLNAPFKSSPSWLQFKYLAMEEFINLEPLVNIETDNWKLKICDIKNEQRDCWVRLASCVMGFSLSFKDYPQSIKYEGHLLMNTYKTLKDFHITFIEKTKDIIQRYASCTVKRQRVMDWLSIEIALLRFEQEKYAECMTILQSSYDFYMESNWFHIGSWLLEKYVECILKCPDVLEFDVDGDLVPRSIILSNSFLNLLISSEDNKALWWDRFLDINNENSDNLIYPLDNIFSLEISPNLIPVTFNKYGLKISLIKKHILQDIAITSIRLLMKNYMDEFLGFEVNDVIIKGTQDELLLVSNRIIWTTFELVTLEVVIGNTVFKKEFDSFETEDCINLIPCHFDKSSRFFIRSGSEQILGNSCLSLYSEYFNNVDKFSLVLEVSEDSGIFFDNNERKITIENLDTTRIIYKNTLQKHTFNLNSTLTFLRDEEEYMEKEQVTVDSALPIFVSVEDIVQTGQFIFNFSLKASSNEPVLLYSTNLTNETAKYSISGHFSLEHPAILNSITKTPYQSLFEVKRINEKFSFRDEFQLSVNYFKVKDYLEEILARMLSPEEDGWVEYTYWVSYIIPMFTFSYKAFEDLRQIKIIGDASQFSAQLKDIKKLKTRNKITKLVNSLINGYGCPNHHQLVKPYELLVPVHLPCIKKLYSVELLPLHDNDNLFTGEPCLFKIIIDNMSQTWEISASTEPAVFSIMNSNEWLIGGKRRFQLDSDHQEMELNLIPLRRGYLSFPSVEITDHSGSIVGEMDYINSNDKLLIF